MSEGASRLRLAREMSGLSLTQVANILGTDVTSISSAEEGVRKVGGDEIARLAEVYEVDRSWLAGEGGDKVDLQDARFGLTSENYEGLDPADLDILRRVLAAMRGTGSDT